jgi:hypothetical protein
MPLVRHLRSAPARLRVPLAVAGCVMVGTLIGLSGAFAKSGGDGKLIHMCVAKAGGAVSFVSANGKCAKGSRSLFINQKGPSGTKGKKGKTGPRGSAGPRGLTGPTGPTGPANTEVVDGPVVTLSGSEPTGSTATSTAGCDHAVSGTNHEAYGGGLVITPTPSTTVQDVVPIQSSYPGQGSTGSSPAVPAASGAGADAWTGIAVISRMFTGDSATVQAYVICGP